MENLKVKCHKCKRTGTYGTNDSISKFNFKTTDDPDFKICCSLKNLQPMWAKENMSKNNKLEKPLQMSLSFSE